MNENFFDFDEEDGGRFRSHWRWIGVVIMLVAIVLCGLLCFAGMRSMQAATADAPYAGHSWVMSGNYVKLTNDLQTTSYNAVYKGELPTDSNMSYHEFDSGMNDPKKVAPGDSVQFRGTQTGAEKSDYPQTVDALLAVDHGVLKVVRTADSGSLEPVTESSVHAHRRNGVLFILGGVLSLLLGLGGLIWSVRRTRVVEGLA